MNILESGHTISLAPKTNVDPNVTQIKITKVKSSSDTNKFGKRIKSIIGLAEIDLTEGSKLELETAYSGRGNCPLQSFGRTGHLSNIDSGTHPC